MGLGALLLALLWGVHFSRGVPSVYLMESSLGNFLLVKGATLSDNSLNITADSLCTCRMQCNAMVGCTAASLVGEVCRLSSSGLQASVFTEHENASLMLWNNTDDGSFWLGVDGRVYLTFSTAVKSGDALVTCSQFPGFRLGSFSSLESMAALKEFYERDGTQVSVDLSINNVWGDGVPYDQTKSLYERTYVSGYNYIMLDGTLIQKSRRENVRLLCQADLANAELP
ncbi:uncharacterized protein [Penaeus vannamei]|uniref:uncharacterized protein n=1 Tax=Penaeus vannamei TaxID=6689 RepID=UPI00387FADB8